MASALVNIMGANGELGSPSNNESGLTDTASAVAEVCPTLQLPQWLRGVTSAEHSLMILKELCQRKQVHLTNERLLAR